MNKPTQREYTIKLPMRLRTSSKKVTALNLNVYRNLHYRSLTALKHKFQDLGKKLLQDAGVPPLGRIQLRYQVFPKTKREFDVANICSIVDKFFSDTLQHAGIIEDDNWKFLDYVSFGFGGFAPEEYVLVTITEIEPRKGNVMRILLDEADIQNALDSFVLNELGFEGATGVRIEATTDGEITAEVLMNETVEPKTPAKPKRGGRKPGSKNKPKEPQDNVELPVQDSDAGDGSGSTEPSTDSSETVEADTPAETKAKTGKSSSKNLFGDEETESSNSDSPEETKDTETPQPVKKSSIFDQ